MASRDNGHPLLWLGALGVGGYVLWREYQAGAFGPPPAAGLPATPTPTPTPAPTPQTTVTPPLITPPIVLPSADLAANPAAFVESLYAADLHRAADPAGAAYWQGVAAQQLAAGVDPNIVKANLETAFMNSVEAKSG